MKTYTQFDAPAKIYGAPLFESTGTLDRLPPELRVRLGPDMEHLGRRCPARAWRCARIRKRSPCA